MPDKSHLQYEQSYIDAWNRIVVRADHIPMADAFLKTAQAARPRLSDVEKLTHVPWWWIAMTLYREAGGINFGAYLGNGQSIHQRTTIVPVGHGPFATFEAGAVDALRVDGIYGATNWDIVAASYRWEKFNGFGYRLHGVMPPYLYAGSNLYSGGLYYADGKFSSSMYDTRLGTVTLLKRLTQIDKTVVITEPGQTVPMPRPSIPVAQPTTHPPHVVVQAPASTPILTSLKKFAERLFLGRT